MPTGESCRRAFGISPRSGPFLFDWQPCDLPDRREPPRLESLNIYHDGITSLDTTRGENLASCNETVPGKDGVPLNTTQSGGYVSEDPSLHPYQIRAPTP